MSVCICTRNRADVIEDAVWSVVLQSAEAETYEVLIVDNGSGDATGLRSLVEQCAVRGRDLRVVEEPRPGLSHAKNRAVQESRGAYVFFLDDDAIAGPRWVERNLEAISTHRPDVLGGHVLPLFAVHPGDELDYSIWPRWSLKHFGSEDRWLGEDEYFLGTNMGAARKLLLEEPYDPTLGRKGDQLGGGEEWYLGDSRFRRRLVTEAYVFHKVPAERLSIDYLARRSVASQKGPVRHSALKRLWIVAGALRFVLREIRGFGRKAWLQLHLTLAIRRLRRRRRGDTEGDRTLPQSSIRSPTGR
jgi:glycosyltransferase involved in cell wall biosynthesis